MQVLPRGPEDRSSFFAVFYGAPVQVAYGALGASILSQALNTTRLQQTAGSDQGTQRANTVESAELVHFHSDVSSINASIAVSGEPNLRLH